MFSLRIDIMSFHESATEFHLEEGHILVATLRNGDGEEVQSTLDLNDHIGNDNGKQPYFTQFIPEAQ